MVHGQVMRAHARPAGEDSRAWYYSTNANSGTNQTRFNVLLQHTKRS
jgi:hypothetical protein